MFPTVNNALAQPAAPGFLETITNGFNAFVDVLSSIVFYAPKIGGVEVPLIVLWLLAGGIFFTVYLSFQQLRVSSLRHSRRLVKGEYTRHTDPGEVTSFQALATELSGTVGLGNIAGVAVAIGIGGPGATLWIILAGIIGMALKMAEATLGVKYRVVDEDGSTSGGPMYYLRDGLAELGHATLGRILAAIFAIATVFGVTGAGNMFQSNQAAAQLIYITGGDQGYLGGKEWAIGIVLALLAGFVILGGIQKIGAVTSKIVPFMALLYLVMCLFVIIPNVHHIPWAVEQMFESAITGRGIAGGALGVMIVGLRRAAFSNAAGIGTAAMAHSAVKTRRPATEGFVAMWEPFVDSVLICTLTALTIILSGVWQTNPEVEGVQMTAAALATSVSWFDVPLTIAVALFAFSTVLSYSYYGMKAVGYLFGGSRRAEQTYNVIYILLIVVGAMAPLEQVINFSDSMFFMMALPNVLGLYFLAGIIKKEIIGHRVKVDAGVISIVPEEEQASAANTSASDSDPSHVDVAHAETVAAFEAAAEARYDALQAIEDDSVSDEDTEAARLAAREAASVAVETAQAARAITEAADDETGMVPEEHPVDPLQAGHATEPSVGNDDEEAETEESVQQQA
ncbi:sodium:alanine symporter [Boudabousia liubingyangii]|uniref:alanine/glycine:cation symporter family protein n=1 Tax=Boudabousia liubingyangii TaxID=1921764 RepID=UPI00093CECB5|nr:sodium:alanine symporter family protein [Boudabousia liubingyangii]OKL48489.1 sodium:alanine symporter [Boudabousia liubingyangii]